MSNRITKEWSDLYVCMSYTTLVMSGIFDAFLTPSGNIIVYLIYGKSFHILSTEDQKGFCIPLGLRGKKYLNNIRLLIFDSIHVQGIPFPRRTFLFSSSLLGSIAGGGAGAGVSSILVTSASAISPALHLASNV